MKPIGVVKLHIQFYLTGYQSKKVKEKPIQCYIHINQWHDNYKPITFSTGIKIHPDYWSKEYKRAKGEQNLYINQQLDALEEVINNVYDTIDFTLFQSEAKNYILKSWIEKKPLIIYKHRYQLERKVIVDKPVTTISPELTLGQYIELRRKDTGGNQYDFMPLAKKLNSFHAEMKVENTLSQISDTYLIEFLKYCIKTEEWTRSQLEKHKKNIRKFYHLAKDTDKLSVPQLTFKHSLLKSVQSLDTKDGSLSLNQLIKLVDLEFLPDEKHIEHARDYFIIGSFNGGLRKSDMQRLFRNIENSMFTYEGKQYAGRMIRGRHKKTLNKVMLPLYPIVDRILSKYNDIVPPIIERNFTKDIREVCKRAGLNNEITLQKENLKSLLTKEYENKKYGKFDEWEKPLHEIVTSSFMRKTFCTTQIKEYKEDSETVQAFSGHSSAEMLNRYIADSGDTATYEKQAAKAFTDTTFEDKIQSLRVVNE